MFRKLKPVWLFILFLTGPALAADLPTTPGWHEVPNTRLRTVCAGDNGFPEVLGAIGCRAIVEAWSGAVFDTLRDRMIVFGGGHNDYYGNELYAFDLQTQTISRLTDPGLPRASTCVTGIVNNTQPNSRHTYDGIEYIEDLDKMFVYGGALACPDGFHGDDTWTFDFATNQWQRMNPAGPQPQAEVGILTAYDPVSKLIFLHDRKHLYTYDAVADVYTQVSTSATTLGYHMAAVIDPVARKFVIVGYDSVQARGAVYVYDITEGGSYSRQTLSTSGADGLVRDVYPGLAYDSSSQSIVGWSKNGGSNVYSLDLSTGEWTAMSFAGGPSGYPSNGTSGRWRYSPNSNLFVYVNGVDDNVYLWKSSAAPLLRPNPPTAVNVQ